MVENAFGMMANRFRVMLNAMAHDAPTVRLITLSCIVLHNIILRKYPHVQRRYIEELNRTVQAGSWRDLITEDHALEEIAPNTATSEAKEIRALLKEWVYSVGRLPFQAKRVGVE